jgi:transcription elongation GreA/GreB family factor
MCRAIVKEDDTPARLPDRPVSTPRNQVTRRGLRLIEQAIALHEHDLARARAGADREAAGKASRELRYWTARRASAEVAEPAPDTASVVFGTAATLLREDDTQVTLRLVGEDEADPAAGRIGWTTPVARALLGAEVGDVRGLPTGAVEIVAIDPAPEPYDIKETE